MAGADEVAAWNGAVAQPDARLAGVGGEAEAAQDVEPEGGVLEAVASSAARAGGRGDEFVEEVLRVDGVVVGGVVVEREVVVGDSGDLEAVEQS